MTFTNNEGVSLPLALWLVSDGYDYQKGEKVISATTLLKSPKQIILSSRVSGGVASDVMDFASARFGTAVHDAVEKAWDIPRDKLEAKLVSLGWTPEAATKIRVNPESQEEGTIPIWFEKRSFRKFQGWTISGKFDVVYDGQIMDIKTTSVWTMILGRKDQDYIQQGSIYRWLNKTLITEDTIGIQFVFTDWSKLQSEIKDDYPKSRISAPYYLPLMEDYEVERFLGQKLRTLDALWEAPEEEIPDCTDEELWKGPSVWKYYAKPDQKRATKNFDSQVEAMLHKATQGKGEVREVQGEPKACVYCPAFSICKQRERYEWN